MSRGDITNSARLLMAPGGVHEVRIPKAGRFGTISGCFDDPEKLAAAVEEFDGCYPAIYISLNPCNPALLARADNRLKPYTEQTTSDNYILRRRWLGIDFDPVRPSGISSTNYEHGRAIAVACGAWDELRSAGWGDPIVGDSGNGGHLIYSFDAPNTDEIKILAQRLLAGVARRCGTEDVAIDLTVFNAAQVWKLYGTLACKGDSTAARPHRRSRLLEVPDKIGTVPLPGRLGA
ncbi:MAG: hypothetical protein WB676_13675 [Bryobacteraceae bacterium]